MVVTGVSICIGNKLSFSLHSLGIKFFFFFGMFGRIGTLAQSESALLTQRFFLFSLVFPLNMKVLLN